MRLYHLSKPISRAEVVKLLRIKKPFWRAGSRGDNSWTYLYSGGEKRGGVCDCGRGSSDWVLLDENGYKAFVQAKLKPRL